MNEPVVIACFLSSAEARAARDALETEGIATEVRPRDDLLPRRCADAFDAGFDLVTGSDDAERAIALVHTLWPEERPTIAPERCGACGSPDVSRLPRLRLFILAAALMLAGGAVTGEGDLFLLMLGITGVLLILTPNRRCRSCGERWRSPSRNG